MIKKIPVREISDIASINVQNISENDRDEMAIPSYLHTNPLIRWLMWSRYETIADLLSEGGNQAVLEFGCGLGMFLPELRSRYGTVYATDLFPQYAMELAKRYQLDIKFINNLDEIADRHLDVIVAADVLEHIEDLGEYLRLFHVKLSPDGWFIVSGPTENVFYKLGRYAAGFWDKGDYHHTNINHLVDEINAYGFKQRDEVLLPFDFLPPLFKVYSFLNFAS